MQRYVLVTGASSGIGAATVRHLTSCGLGVISGQRDVLAADSDALSADSATIALDVTSAASICAATAAVKEMVGDAGLWAVVNSAGIAVGGPLELVPVDLVREQLEVNVIGTIAVTQALLPLIRRARGRITNISSISGRMSTPCLGPYAASKFALEAISDAWRAELRPWGINVSTIAPGRVKTPIWDKAEQQLESLASNLSASARELYREHLQYQLDRIRQSHARGIDPSEVAVVVGHAVTSAKPRARYVVGRDARLGNLLKRVLPERAMDRLMAKPPFGKGAK